MTGFSVTITPRFSETDALGHINNIPIMAWFEVARTQLLDALEPRQKATEKGWVLANVTVDYIDEMYYGSDVAVGITDVTIGNSSLTMVCEMHQDERLTARGKATLVLIDLDTKAKKRIPDALRETVAGL